MLRRYSSRPSRVRRRHPLRRVTFQMSQRSPLRLYFGWLNSIRALDTTRRYRVKSLFLVRREQFMYAVIGIGGKQVRVSPGETVRVETLPVDPGTSVTFDQVLMIGGETGTLVGTPVVAGAKV